MRAQTLNRAGFRAAGSAGLAGLLLAVCVLSAGLAQGQTSQSSSPQNSAQQNAKPSAQQPVSAPMVMGQDPESAEDAGGGTAGPVSQPASSAPSTPIPRPAATPPAAAPIQPAAAAAAQAPVPANAGDDSARQQINNECANLLQMANDLKAAVDKTNKDMLSVAVVRKANEIETLAHHVKDEMRPEVGKN